MRKFKKLGGNDAMRDYFSINLLNLTVMLGENSRTSQMFLLRMNCDFLAFFVIRAYKSGNVAAVIENQIVFMVSLAVEVAF